MLKYLTRSELKGDEKTMRGYAKGRRFEYRVRDAFLQNGYVVIRAAQSKPVDLVCLKEGKSVPVECKTEIISRQTQAR